MENEPRRLNDVSSTTFEGAKLPAPHTFGSAEEAWRWLDEKRVEINQGDHVDTRDGRVTFGAYAEEWMRSSAAATHRPSTRDRDCGYLRRYILPEFGQLPLSDIDFERVDRWIVQLQMQVGRGGAAAALSTARVAGTVLKRILDRAVKPRRLRHTPCSDGRLPTINAKSMKIVTVEEIEGLSEGIDDRYRAFPIVTCYTGLRAGEIFGLK